MTTYPKMSYKKFTDETNILPHLVADVLGATPEENRMVVNRLLTICEHNVDFYKQCKARGNKGRNHVYMFLDHWIKALRSPIRNKVEWESLNMEIQ